MPTPEDGKEPSAAGARKPYAAPAVSWEEAFEVKANLASACEKMGTDGGQCAVTPAS
jgi:hypothetical protein